MPYMGPLRPTPHSASSIAATWALAAPLRGTRQDVGLAKRWVTARAMASRAASGLGRAVGFGLPLTRCGGSTRWLDVAVANGLIALPDQP
jgi:hypothetical protein